jgi:hypothetical protein
MVVIGWIVTDGGKLAHQLRQHFRLGRRVMF